MKNISRSPLLKRALVIALVASTLGACSSESTSHETQQGSRQEALPQCIWSVDYALEDAAPGACHAARTFLSCEGSDGSTEECMSDNLESCPDDGGQAVKYSSCVDQCRAGEFALSCGSIGGGPREAPPANCRNLPPNPGGITFACCPCAS